MQSQYRPTPEEKRELQKIEDHELLQRARDFIAGINERLTYFELEVSIRGKGKRESKKERKEQQ